MIYRHTYTTKWHDTDPRLVMRPGATLVYLEETSWLHMKSVGRSLDEMRVKDKKGFILSRIGIVFHKPVSPYTEITVETYTNDAGGFSSPRHFEMFADGEKVAEATSIWALVDLETHRPVKISAWDFGFAHEEKAPEGIPTRVAVPREVSFETVGTREIRYSDIDYNGHMNNTKYPDMLMDFVPEPQTKCLRGMVLSFRREAALGQHMTVLRAEKENGYLFRTLDEDGNICLEAEVFFAQEK